VSWPARSADTETDEEASRLLRVAAARRARGL